MLRFTASLALSTLLVCSLTGVSQKVDAAVLASGSITGDQIAALPVLTTRPTSVAGTTLNVGPGGLFLDRLVEIPLLSAGLVSFGQLVEVEFSISETPPTGAISDHDLYVAVSDGDSYVGFGRQDNSGWRGFLVEGDSSGPTGIQTTLFSGVGFDSSFSGSVVADGLMTTVSGSFSGNSGQAVPLSMLVPSQGLSLVVLLDETDESYAIDSLEFVVRSVPEPTSALLVAICSLGALLRRR